MKANNTPGQTPNKPRRKRVKFLKPSSKSKILKLTEEQREQVIHWLFKDNHSYEQVKEMVEKEFGHEISRDAFRLFYNKVARERNLARIFACSKHADAILKAIGKDADKVYQALVQVLAQLAFETAVSAKEGEPPDLGTLLDALPLLIDARKDAREDKKFSLERERWEFDVVRMCHDHFNELQTIIGNPALDEPSRLKAIRRRLFGKNLSESEQ